MQTKPAYIVIDTFSKTIKRTTQRWPALYAGEIVVRVALDVPDDILPRAQVITVDDPEYIAVTATGEKVELP